MARPGKIALGLGCAAIAIAVGGSLGWWLIRKLRAADEEAAVRAAVTTMPFAPPANGQVPEDRLLVFLEVCRRTKVVEQKYQKPVADLKKANEQDTIDPNALVGSFAFVQEVQAERRRALAALGMGLREFRWIRLRLGETAWGSDRAGASPDDTINAPLFEKHDSELTVCLDMTSFRQDLDNFRRAIRDGSP